MEKVGIVAFAFGQHQGDHPVAGISNSAIAHRTSNIRAGERARGNEVVVVTQWETALGLSYSSEPDFCVSKFGSDTHHVDTKTVFDASMRHFKDQGVGRVVFVAQPLHLFFIHLLVRTGRWSTGGLAVDSQYVKTMQHIPYDTSEGNTQWWTKGPLVFILYLGKVLLTRKHG
jgi:hypothetical protein